MASYPSKLICGVDPPAIASSAHRHGVDEETIIDAFNNPIHAEDLEEEMTMLIGPDRASNLYELGVVDSQDGPIVAHAMPARRKYLP